MKRKVNRVGQNTLTVSLPSKWVREVGLKKGDEVDLSEDGSSLTIGSINRQKEKLKAEVFIDYSKNIPKRLFLMPYIKGYDEIKIIYDDSKVVDFVEKNLFILTGFELVEQFDNYILIKNIVKIDDESFNQVHGRMFNLVITMIEKVKNSYLTGDFDGIDVNERYESLINKLDFYCRRILNVHGSANELTNNLYSIVRNLEYVSDIIRDWTINNQVFKKDLKVAKSMDILLRIFNIYRKMMSKKNDKLIVTVKNLEHEYLNAIKNLHSVEKYLHSLYYPIHHISEEIY